MIDLLPNLSLTDTEKQIYSSMAAALLGALVGTITTYFIGNRERKKQDELHKIRLNRTYIHESSIGIQSAELTLTELLIKCEANNEYVSDIQKGFFKQDGKRFLALMQLSTPFAYTKPDLSITQKILNDRIVTLWANLCQEIELQNKNINDFSEYYKVLFGTIHTALLRGEKIDTSVVASDNKIVSKGMEQQLTANGQLRKKCLDLLAQITCFKDYIRTVDIKEFKSLQEYRSFIDNMANFEPEPSALVLAWEAENNTYDPKIMFKSKSTGD